MQSLEKVCVFEDTYCINRAIQLTFGSVQETNMYACSL